MFTKLKYNKNKLLGLFILTSSFYTLAKPVELAETKINAVVTASGFEQDVEDAPATISVITRENIEKKSYKDVTDALRDVPGVFINGSGTNTDISIRGMSSGYTVILIDGKKQNSRETRPNSDGSGMEQGFLPPVDMIERIEVVRGSMSSLYGSDAIGGVINIITRKPAKDRWQGNIKIETTKQDHSYSGDIEQQSIFVQGPIIDDERFGLQLSGSSYHRAEDKLPSGFTQHLKKQGSAKLTFAPNSNHDFAVDSSFTRQERNQTKGYSSTRDSDNNYDKKSYALTHNGQFGIISSNSYIQFDDTDNPGRDMYLKNTEIQSSFNLPIGDANFTTFGAYYKNEDLTDLGNQIPNSISKLRRYQSALFAENETSVNDQLAITTGVRVTDDQKYGIHYTPRIYTNFKANEEFTIKGGVSRGFKAPAIRAVVADWGQVTGGGGSINPAVILGEPNLKPEKSESIELGLLWNNRNNLDASITIFKTNFRNRSSSYRSCTDGNGGHSSNPLVGNCDIDGNKFKWISKRYNVGSAAIKGLELTTTWHVTPNFTLGANFTRNDSKIKDDPNPAKIGAVLNNYPKNLANIQLDWQIQKFDVWSRINHRSKTLDDSTATSQKPGFTFVDIGTNYALSKNTKLGFAVYNLEDKTINSKNPKYDVTYDGIRYWLSLNQSF